MCSDYGKFYILIFFSLIKVEPKPFNNINGFLKPNLDLIRL